MRSSLCLGGSNPGLGEIRLYAVMKVSNDCVESVGSENK